MTREKDSYIIGEKVGEKTNYNHCKEERQEQEKEETSELARNAKCPDNMFKNSQCLVLWCLLSIYHQIHKSQSDSESESESESEIWNWKYISYDYWNQHLGCGEADW